MIRGLYILLIITAIITIGFSSLTSAAHVSEATMEIIDPRVPTNIPICELKPWHWRCQPTVTLEPFCAIFPSSPKCSPWTPIDRPDPCEINPWLCTDGIRPPPVCLSCPKIDIGGLNLNESVLITDLPGGSMLMTKVPANTTADIIDKNTNMTSPLLPR